MRPGLGRGQARQSAHLKSRSIAVAPRMAPPSRACCAGFSPGLDQFTKLLLRSWRRRSPGSRVPAPADQGIFRHVLDQLGHVLAAVALAILDLDADLAKRFS